MTGTGNQIDRTKSAIAAANAGDLYAAMFSAHEIPFVQSHAVFEGIDRPPPFYSDITVKAPDHLDVVMAAFDRATERSAGRAGIKDSFCEIDLAQTGLIPIFEAHWIWRDAGHSALICEWFKIDSTAALSEWEMAWKRCGSPTPQLMFPPSLLDTPHLTFLARRSAGELTAGCLLTQSDVGVGLSNVFCRDTGSNVFAQAANAASCFAPDAPIVGYERGNALHAAKDCGFDVTGRLRVLTPLKPQ